MKLRELVLSDLSRLRSRCFLCEFAGTHNPKALVLEFAGKYGVGSLGNDDAAYIEATKSAWLSVLRVDAIVFDLRQMEYEWGNSIWNAFRWGTALGKSIRHEGKPQPVYPTALVVSELCQPGFSTCEGMVPPMFDDLDAALTFVEAPARKYLEELIAQIGFDVE